MKKFIALSICLFISFTIQSQNLSELYDKVHSSIVVIKTASNVITGQGAEKKVNTAEGLGSGVLISEDGLIWTASHVIHTAEIVVVRFPDGDVYEAQVLSSNPSADVALLKLGSDFKLKNKHVAQIGNSDNIKIGEDIFVIGSPLGIEQTLTRGIVSGRMSKGNLNDDFLPIEFIQTDAAINPGNSGGPLFNMKGEIIGIASFIMSQSGGFEGIGFGASSNVASKILMDQPNLWSGMEFALLSGELADAFNLPQNTGLLVLSVSSGGIGNELGLRGGTIQANIEGSNILIGGDVILEIGGIVLDSEEAILLLRQKMVLFETMDIDVKYLRAGKVETVTIKR